MSLAGYPGGHWCGALHAWWLRKSLCAPSLAPRRLESSHSIQWGGECEWMNEQMSHTPGNNLSWHKLPISDLALITKTHIYTLWYPGHLLLIENCREGSDKENRWLCVGLERIESTHEQGTCQNFIYFRAAGEALLAAPLSALTYRFTN